MSEREAQEPQAFESTPSDERSDIERPEPDLTRDERRQERQRLKSVRSERRKQRAQRSKNGKNQSKGKGEGGKNDKKRR